MDLEYCFIDKKARDDFGGERSGEDEWIKKLDYNYKPYAKSQELTTREYPQKPGPPVHVELPPMHQAQQIQEFYQPSPQQHFENNLLSKFTHGRSANPCTHHAFHEFWLNEPLELIDELYILPSKNMTLNQKLNATVRGAAVVSIGAYILNKNKKMLYILILAILASIFLYYSKASCSHIHDVHKISKENKLKAITKALTTSGLDKKDIISDAELHHAVKDLPISHDEAKSIIKDAVLTENGISPQKQMPNSTQGPQTSQGSAEAQQPEKEVDTSSFNIPENYNWTRENAHKFDQNLFCGIDQRMENEINERNEVLLTHGDYLDFDFAKELTKDWFGDSKFAREWRAENPHLVDRDVFNGNNNKLFYDPW